MNVKDIDINVFSLYTLEYKGVVNEVKAITWSNKFIGYGEFELWAPVTKSNIELLRKTNIIWIGGKSAARIEKISTNMDDNGDKVLNVKGRTLESLLTTRVILGTFIDMDNYRPRIMSNIVNVNCINPANSDRKIPFITLDYYAPSGDIISYQKTGGEVYDALIDVCNNEYGFSLDFYPKEKEFRLSVYAGIDRTRNQNDKQPVIFDTSLEDILTSVYSYNESELKTMAYVAGEGEGVNRKVKQTGAVSDWGFNRRELYVDARNLQSIVSNESGTQITLTQEEYMETLNQHGKKSLSEKITIETFEATLRVLDNPQYVFGVDYNIGDKIVIIDRELQVTIDAMITEYEESFDSEYTLSLTLGFLAPTISNRIKRMNN